MERVTVHLQAVGIRHFTGPSCYHEAEKWVHDEIRRRDRACPKGSGVDLPVERDPDMPEASQKKIGTPTTARAHSLLWRCCASAKARRCRRRQLLMLPSAAGRPRTGF